MSHDTLGLILGIKITSSLHSCVDLEHDKIKRMALQYIYNSGSEVAKRSDIMEYLAGTLPSRNTPEQNGQMVGNILKELAENNLIKPIGKKWFEKDSTQKYTKNK